MVRSESGKNLTHDLAEKIGTMIVRGDVAAGENLPIEADLCAMFNASRTVTREAVKMLTAKGLVGQRPKRGTYVEQESNWNFLDPDVLEWILQRQFSPELMREFLVVRRVIEPAAAVEVIKHGTDSDIDIIGAAMADFRRASPGEEALSADIAFHVSILEACRNRFLRQFAPMVETALRFSIRKTNEAKGVSKADLDAHEAIYHAIRARDEALAMRLFIELLDEAIALMESAAVADQRASRAAKA
ncbi:FadR family transcriptional regulator [Parvularcula flava]|uniref:FadR family transcriptional regulator n=1 Tax=Aquisalinus luteolus TaxID=1566827 RepID=A0A8J3EVZ9_9PROT|nr:FadR/GntR family transcriptional regulator [Aquisalinus luteolus]NHK29646.1 FadR family transcriptional regulator [Aquisalinus luteolus]GGI02228.1 GntR family transcriptional regulator [Aquisalinus luteolus]